MAPGKWVGGFRSGVIKANAYKEPRRQTSRSGHMGLTSRGWQGLWHCVNGGACQGLGTRERMPWLEEQPLLTPGAGSPGGGERKAGPGLPAFLRRK